jgi:hypothetical protein
MDLICPHCQQKITVADSLGGQTTNCPRCSGPFTAPLLPPSMSSGGHGSAHGVEAGPPGYGSTFAAESEPSAASAAGQQPLPAGGIAARRGIILQSNVVRWIAPACLVLNFFLFFFPWVGVYIGGTVFGGTMLARQSGGGIAFGLSPVRQDEKFLSSLTSTSGDALLVLYFLVLLVGFVVSVGLAAIAFGPEDFRRKLPPSLPQILVWRTMAIAGIAALAFFFVELHHLFMSFSIESLAQASAPAVFRDVREAAKGPELADALFAPLVQRTGWFSLVVSLNWLALLGALTDLWLERRGQRPPPRLLLEW